MVYDRTRTVRSHRDSSAFGSSGSPRARFPSDSGGNVLKSGPQGKHDAVPVSNRLTNDIQQDTKRFVELISERVFFFIQRESAEKKLRKLRLDMSRSQTCGFPSAADMLDLQTRSAELEKDKISHRVTNIDDKLQQVINTAWLSLGAPLHAKAFRQDPTPPPSETSSDTALTIDEKLSQMQDNIENTMRNRFAEESQRLESKLKADYGTQIAALQEEILRERSLRTTFQSEIQNDLQKVCATLGSVEAKIKEHTKQVFRLDEAIKREAFEELELRLVKLEASRTITTAQAENDLAHNVAVDSDEMQALQLATDKDTNLETLKVEDAVKQVLLQSREELVPDERILRLVQPKVSAVEINLQKSLRRIAEKLGPIIDKERSMRAGLAVEVTSAAQEIEAIKAGMARIQTACDSNSQSATASISNQASQLQNISLLLKSTNDEMQSIKAHCNNSAEALSMRLSSVQAWQNNFGTRDLFDAIVKHLNYSFVHEHVVSLQELRARVDGLEGHIGEITGSKRRKLPEKYETFRPLRPLLPPPG